MSGNDVIELRRLADAISGANKAAEKLLKCAESISNPVYSVTIQGVSGECTILAVRHFQGQINILVKSPLNDIPNPELKTIGQPHHVIEQRKKEIEQKASDEKDGSF